MSFRNRLVLPIILSALAVLAGCGSSTPAAVPPPNGSFSNKTLKGTYVFSTSGSDVNGFFFTMAGTIDANGSGVITGGTLDINDSDTQVSQPIQSFGQAINGNSVYTVGVDGRGQIKLVNTALGTIEFDFVLNSSTGGLITEFDTNGSGSGTLELQTSTITQAQMAQGYAFTLSGFDANSNFLGGAGAFTLGADGSITNGTGVHDFNDSLLVYPNQPLSGSATLGSGGGSGTLQLSTALGALSFNFYVVDANHFKFIETDPLLNPVLSGDAFQQAPMPTGTVVFTLAGESLSGGVATPLAFGGIFGPLSGAGLTINGSEDANVGGTGSSTPIPFTLDYTTPVNGRSAISLTSFAGGPVSLAAYPSSGGLLMVEDDVNALTSGAAYTQSATSLATPPQGYGLNLSGINLSINGTFELDDIAEFATSSSAGPQGLLDENDQGNPLNPQTISSKDSSLSLDSTGSGRGEATFASSSTAGLFGITFYTVDASNTIFIENDGSTQIAVGSFHLQNSGAQAAAAVQPILMRPVVIPHPSVRRRIGNHSAK
jgi:hypothetical protein